MIKIGKPMISVCNGDGIIWQNDGIVKFKGPCSIGKGFSMSVAKTGTVVFGENFCATDGVRIICYKKIIFGSNVLIGYESNFMDTNQHCLSNKNGDLIGNPTAPIFIGNDCWIASNCTIMPGVYLPPRCVVAGHSLLNKTKGVESYTLLAGIPAKPKLTGVWRNPFNDKIIYNE